MAGGCSSMNNTDRGALIGTGAGALIGNAVAGRGHKTTGTAIGAAAGLLAGTAIGSAKDDEQAAAAAQPKAGPLGLTDVANMAQQGVSDSVIIGQIRSTGSHYNLSSSDIIWLKQSNVSDAVIQEMQRTARTTSAPPPRVIERTTVVEQPVYLPARPVYVMPAPPPPPPGFSVGVGYSSRR
jgi:hypothetical protein